MLESGEVSGGEKMRVEINYVTNPKQERVVLECMELKGEFADIHAYCLAKSCALPVFEKGRMQRSMFMIFYILKR